MKLFADGPTLQEIKELKVPATVVKRYTLFDDDDVALED